jgi:hypothetical protein
MRNPRPQTEGGDFRFAVAVRGAISLAVSLADHARRRRTAWLRAGHLVCFKSTIRPYNPDSSLAQSHRRRPRENGDSP